MELSGGVPAELGATYLYDDGTLKREGTALGKMARRSGCVAGKCCAYSELDEIIGRPAVRRQSDGREVDPEELKRCGETYAAAMEELEKRAKEGGREFGSPHSEDDVSSYEEYLERYFAYGGDAGRGGRFTEVYLDFISKFEHFENGTKRLAEVGISQFEFSEFSYTLNLDPSYQAIIDAITRDIPTKCIHLNSEVSTITWTSSPPPLSPSTPPVVLLCRGGQSYPVEHVIVTCSVGVLQAHCLSQRGSLGVLQDHCLSQPGSLGVLQDHCFSQPGSLGVLQDHCLSQPGSLGVLQDHCLSQSGSLGVLQDHCLSQPGSLGVLQDHCLSQPRLFSPPLPVWKLSAIKAIGMGRGECVIFEFEKPLLTVPHRAIELYWLREEEEVDKNKEGKEKTEEVDKASKRFQEKELCLQTHLWARSIYILLRVGDSSAYKTWLTGEDAAAMAGLPDRDIGLVVCAIIRKFLGRTVERLPRIIRSTWCSDPFIRGCYSYNARGSGRVDREELGRPVDGCTPLQLLFAGEATHPTMFSTTNGAFESGEREAETLIQLYTNKC